MLPRIRVRSPIAMHLADRPWSADPTHWGSAAPCPVRVLLRVSLSFRARGHGCSTLYR